MAYPTTTEHYKVYPYTSIMGSPYSCDPTGVIDCAASIESIKANQSNTGTISIPKGTFKISTNITIPIGMRLQFESGSSFSIDAGKILTIQCPVVSYGLENHFSGAGSVSIGTSFSALSVELTPPVATIVITTNTTIPSNIHLTVKKGTIFSIAAGATLTINGTLDAGLYQIFSCTGTGAVKFGDATHWAKVKEVYPQWWGAKGDGSQDDVTYIQAAIDCFSNANTTYTGGTVYISPGNYLIAASGLTVGGTITIKGAGGKESRIYTTAPAAAVVSFITGSDVSNVVIDGLYFYGGATARSWVYGGGVGFAKGYYCTIKNCTFEKLAGYAVGFGRIGTDNTTYSAYCTAENNIVVDCYSDGIGGLLHYYTKIINNTLDTVGTDADNFGIAGDAVFYATIANNVVKNCAGYGISIGNETAPSMISHSTVTGNNVIGTAYYGIYIAGTKYVDVTNNTVTASGGCGILIKTPTNEGGYHSGINVVGNQCNYNASEGIVCLEQGCNITNNLLSCNWDGGGVVANQAGILLGAFSKNNMVQGNFITNSATETGENAGNQTASVYVMAGAVGNQVVNNYGGAGYKVGVGWIDNIPVVDSGTGTIIRGNPGYPATPTVPATTVEQLNTFGQPCRVAIAGGNITVIAKGFTTGALITTTATSGTFILEPNERIALTYTAFTDATGDTDGSTAVITGLTSTAGFSLGGIVTVTAGFPAVVLTVIGKTATTLTLDVASTSVGTNVTVAQAKPVWNWVGE